MLTILGWILIVSGTIFAFLSIILYVDHPILKGAIGATMWLAGIILLANIHNVDYDYINACKHAGGFTIENHSMCVKEIEIPSN